MIDTIIEIGRSLVTIVSLCILVLQIDVNRMTDSWPYPSAQEIWDRLDNTFSNEDDYEDLRIQDFVVSGRLMAQRRLDRLTMPRGQSSVLERGTISLGVNEVPDASVDTALGYTSVVGTMLAEELANAEDQVSDPDHTFCHSLTTSRSWLCRIVYRRLSSLLLVPTLLWRRWSGGYESWRCLSG